MYYGFVQNLIFTTLQQALFALLPEFDPEDDEEKYEKLIQTKQERVINGMVDTILRGSGLTGAVVATIKNTLNQYYRQEKKGYMADHTYTILEVANISPPIGSKLAGALQISWDVNAKNEEHELIKTNAKAARKEAGKEKAKKTRKENADKLKALEKKIPGNVYGDYMQWKKGKTIKEKIKYIEQNY